MTSPSALRRPPGRYDDPRPLPTWARVGGAALVVVALVAFSFVGYRHWANGRAPFTNDGFSVDSDTAVTVRFSVVVEAHHTVRCGLQARDRDNTEVGSKVVTLTSGTSRTLHRSERFATAHRAVAAEVLSCRPA